MRITTDEWAKAGLPLDLAPGAGAYVFEDGKWVHDYGEKTNAILAQVGVSRDLASSSTIVWCCEVMRHRATAKELMAQNAIVPWVAD